MRHGLVALLLLVCAVPAWAQKRVVCIDPGHPSEISAGARGKEFTEVAAAWQVAVRLRKLLQDAGFEVVMTKASEGEKVTNQRRAQIANQAKADLMIRLHCDAAPVRGFATYYPAKQGTHNGIKGPSAEVIRRSKEIAEPFHRAAMSVLKGALPDRGVKTDGHTAIGAKNGGALIGSIYSEVPVLLVEMCVITQPKDEAFIKTAKGQQQMAEALLAGTRAALTPKAAKRR